MPLTAWLEQTYDSLRSSRSLASSGIELENNSTARRAPCGAATNMHKEFGILTSLDHSTRFGRRTVRSIAALLHRYFQCIHYCTTRRWFQYLSRSYKPQFCVLYPSSVEPGRLEYGLQSNFHGGYSCLGGPSATNSCNISKCIEHCSVSSRSTFS
jgi:hypothetical protein